VTWGTDFHSYIQREERLFPKVLDLHGHRLTRLTAGATATVGVEKDGSLLLFKDLQSPPEILSISGSTVVQAVDTLDTLWALTAEGKLYRWQKMNGELPAGECAGGKDHSCIVQAQHIALAEPICNMMCA
jgi:hypothetical protein